MSVRKPGLRVSSPSGYAFRSKEKKREALIRAAFVAPSMFQGGVVRAHVFPLRPRDRKTWDCLLAVDIPVAMEGEIGDKRVREFGVVLRDGSEVVHTFGRKVSLRAQGGGGAGRKVSFVEPVSLRPGDYTVTAVMASADSVKPYTSNIRVAVPPIPKGEAFLVEPILGKRAMGDRVVHASGERPEGEELTLGDASKDRMGSARSFMPLLVQRVDRSDPIVALTQACLVKKGRTEKLTVDRDLSLQDGTPTGTLPAASLALKPGGKVACQSLLDILPVPSMRPGEYVFRATLHARERADPPLEIVRFSVAAPTPEPAAAKE